MHDLGEDDGYMKARACWCEEDARRVCKGQGPQAEGCGKTAVESTARKAKLTDRERVVLGKCADAIGTKGCAYRRKVGRCGIAPPAGSVDSKGSVASKGAAGGANPPGAVSPAQPSYVGQAASAIAGGIGAAASTAADFVAESAKYARGP